MQAIKIAQLTGHNASIFALIEGQDAHQIFTAAGDGWVVAWDLENPDLGKLIAKVDRQIFCLCYLRKEQKIVAGNMDGGVHFIDLNSPEATKNIAHHQRGVFDILEANGSIFTAGGDGKLSRWSMEEMRSSESYHLANQALRTVVFSKKRNELAVGSSDGSIYLLDAQTLELRQKIAHAHASSVFSLHYSPDESHLLSGGRDAHLNVWDLENDFTKISSQAAHLFTVNSLSFSADGQHFATGSRDKTVKIWSASNYELLKVLEGGRDGGHFNSVNKVFWSKHEDLLVSCSDDRTCILWKIIA